MLESAIQLASRGWPLIPLDGKVPRLRDWPNRATRDSDALSKWSIEFPDCNFGIVTDLARLIVLDFDPRNGGDIGKAVMVEQYGRETLELGVSVQTGSGGEHIYFRCPADADPSDTRRRLGSFLKESAGPGIDVPAMVVAPGSVHSSGKTYLFDICDELREVPELPSALLLHCVNYRETLHPPVGSIETRVAEFYDESPQYKHDKSMLEALATLDPARLEKQWGDRGCVPTRNTLKWERTPGARNVKKNGRTGSQVISAESLGIARDYYRVYGGHGLPVFLASTKRKARISPEYDLASVATNDKRHPLSTRRVVRAWLKAVAEPHGDRPIDLESPAFQRRLMESEKWRNATRVYAALFLEAWRLGVRVTNFSINYDRIGLIMGIAKQTAWRFAMDAEECGLLAITDRGQKRAYRVRGRSATFSLLTLAGSEAFVRIQNKAFEIARLIEQFEAEARHGFDSANRVESAA